MDVQNLTRGYPLDHSFVSALEDVTFDIEAGEFMSVAGPSGSGKSTLLNLIGCAELEHRLEPRRFLGIHRAAMVDLDWVLELDAWVGGGALVRFRDEKRTELAVAPDRVRALKERLGVGTPPHI